jgi:DNA-binding transcriptional MocR family regulator
MFTCRFYRAPGTRKAPTTYAFNMIDLVWNFPLFAGQGAEWQGYLRRAVDGLHVEDARELRPSFRGADASLRVRAAKYLGVEPERAWITCGGHHGTLVALLAAELGGKTIAVEAITYTAVLEQAKMLGATLVPCAYDGEGMTPEALRVACEAQKISAVFLMPTVHNPLGIVAGLERREALVALAREFDLIILEDDAYGFMEPTAPPNYAVLAPERTFYVRGLSKLYAPATRTGFLVVPERFTGVIESVIKSTTTGTALVYNMAALALIEDGTLARTMAAKLVEGAVRNVLGREILGDAAAPGPKSGWHLWVSLPESLTALEVQKRCLERGVMVSPANGFTPPGATVPRAIRVGLGGEVEREKIAEGVAIVAEVIAL